MLQFPGPIFDNYHITVRLFASQTMITYHRHTHVFKSHSLGIVLHSILLQHVILPSIRLLLLYAVENQDASWTPNLVTKNVSSGSVRIQSQKEEPLQGCSVVSDLCSQQQPVTWNTRCCSTAELLLLASCCLGDRVECLWSLHERGCHSLADKWFI